MPLSEHEQRLLEQIERGLSAQDPRLATAFRTTTVRARTVRKIALYGLGVLAGVTLLVVGVVSGQIVVACLGFVAMFVSVLAMVNAVRQPAARTRRGAPPAKIDRSSWTERAEERFRRRFDSPDV